MTSGTEFGGTLHAGAPVITADGERIGTVKRLEGTVFQVDAPMRPDYWLRIDCIRTTAGGEVLLSVSRDQLDSYKAEAARDDGLAPGYKPSGVAPVASDGDPGVQPAEYMANAPAEAPEAVPGVRMGRPDETPADTITAATLVPSANPSVVRGSERQDNTHDRA